MKDRAVDTYARVLLELSSLTNTVDKADEDMTAAAKAVRGHVDLKEALTDPRIPAEKKRDVLREIFGGEADPSVIAVLGILVDSGRLDIVDSVARTFSEIAQSERGVLTAEVTTAVPLDEGMQAKVSEKLSASLGRPVNLRTRVDASVLGGIVIKVAGRVFDGSLAAQLSGVRQALSAGSAGGEA